MKQSGVDILIRKWGACPISELTAELNVSRATVMRWAKKAGLPIKQATQKSNLSGYQMGKVNVIRVIGKKKGRKVYECQCECGRKTHLTCDQLLRNQVPSCPMCKLTVAKDLTGKRFGKLVAVRRSSDRTKYGSIKWICKCDCGNETEVTVSLLTTGRTRSCGCYSMERRLNSYHDWTGKRFGRLIAIKRIGNKWECKCDCGNVTLVATPSLVNGVSRSCGCLRSEGLSGAKSRFWKGGVTEWIHGLKHTSQYFTWAKKVKKRDNYTCQCCESRDSLNAHHIYNFIDNMEKAIEMDNGITLCENCHKDFHKVYGKRNTNEKQLLDFLANNAMICPRK